MNCSLKLGKLLPERYVKMYFTYIALLVAFAIIIGGNLTPTNELEQELLVLLNKWREGSVQTKLFPLPSLKTININSINSYYVGRGFTITFSIGDMTLTGLNEFSVDYINVTHNLDDLNFSAKFVVPVLTIHSENYKLQGRAYLWYPIQGDGQMTGIFRKVEISIKVLFSTVDGVTSIIRITDFLLDYDIKEAEAYLENSSWIINQVLNREGVHIIKSFHDEINNAIWRDVLPNANYYLANTTLDDFISIISDISVNSYVVQEDIS